MIAEQGGMNNMLHNDWLWWRDGVIYHIYLRSFADSDGDGLGDLPGLIGRLDHLNGSETSLGVDAIWLSPCYPSPDKDFGYDVADYCAIDPRYGTMADFDHLIREAHQRGIRVILDLVFNHTSDQHPWFLASRASRQNPKRDWYLWRDPGPKRRPPNNWQSIFGGKAWEWDETTEQYYYHMFLREQPDLNWRNPLVRKQLMDVVRFWLDRGVDGFRLDVFNLWYKHTDLANNPPYLGLRGYDRQRHLYDMDQPEMSDALAEFRQILDSYPERAAVGEPLTNDPYLAASYAGPEKLHMVFNFEFSNCRWSPTQFLHAIQRWETAVGPQAWPCYVLSNHDAIRRHISRYGRRNPEAVARVAAALLLTVRGTPFLYYGEEIAQPNVPLRRSQLVDPVSRRYWPIVGRDQGRTPMQWDDSPNAGFSSGTPWLPVHPNYLRQNVQCQRDDPSSVFCFYRDLIRLRRESPALRRGSFQALTPKPKTGLAYLRESGDQRALVALNFTPRPIYLNLKNPPKNSSWNLALSTHPYSRVRVQPSGIELAPHEVTILLSKNRIP